MAAAGVSWPRRQDGQWPPPIILIIFQSIKFSEILMFQSDNFHTFAVGKGKCFEYCQKIFELGPSYSIGIMTPLYGCVNLITTFEGFMQDNQCVV